jgi:hypothetical protein
VTQSQIANQKLQIPGGGGGVADWRELLRFELEHRNLLRIWEPLRTNAGGLARPHRCYMDTVIFYAMDRTEIDRVEHHFLQGAFGAHTLIFWRGSWWEIGCGEVKFSDDRWWMVHRLWRNHRVPMRLNGEEAWLGQRAVFPWWWRIVRPMLDRLRDARLIDGRPPFGFDDAPTESFIDYRTREGEIWKDLSRYYEFALDCGRMRLDIVIARAEREWRR